MCVYFNCIFAIVFAHVAICPYLATWHYPVGNSQEWEAYSYSQDCPALHTNGLLPQARQILIPDSQQLLLAVRMSNELKQKKINKKLKSVENEGR